MSSLSRRLGRACAATAVTVLALAASACGESSSGDALTDIKDRGYLTIGVLNNAPQTSIDPVSGEWVGFDAEIAQAVADELGVELRPQLLDHTALISAVTTGRVDMVDGLAKTAERESVVAYSEPIWWSPTDVVVRDDSPIQQFTDLGGLTIAAPAGSAQLVAARNLQSAYGLEGVAEYKDFSAVGQDVAAGRADAGIWGYVTFNYAKSQNPQTFGSLRSIGSLDPSITEFDAAVYYVMAKEGTDSLRTAVNDALATVQSGGTAERIFDSYDYDLPYLWTGQQ
jgi:polar amino acid transport system substrate-binding protein